MSHYNGCGCSGGCNSCTSHNEIQQAVNDALAFEKENLEQYETNAAQSATDAAKEAADAASSASAAAQSQANAETAAGTATQAAASVTDTAVILEETAERIEHAQDLLEEQISTINTKPVYFEVTEATSALVLPETETVFNVRSIYVASARQDVGYGFTFNKETRTITLAEAITADQIAETDEGFILVTTICDVYSSDDPTSFPIILASNAGATNIGTSTGSTVETRLATLDSEVDPTLRQNLGSSEEGLGGSLVKLPQGITLTEAMAGVIVVAGADDIGMEDATSLIQQYIDYASAHGISKVRIPSGTYKVQQYTHEVTLPHDDGTVYPAWVAAGTDQNIDAEEVHTMKAALKLPSGIKLIGDGMNTTILDGGWDIASSTIGLDGGIGVWYSTSNMQSDFNAGGMEDIGLTNFFIARYGTGCTVDIEENNIKVKNSGAAAFFQAKERCKQGFIFVEEAFTGDVVGGQWWYRSNSTAAAYMPPYPAPQIYLTGWHDACITEQYWFIQYLEEWGERHEAFDAFFDTYFFKSANNATYANGGRLSNTTGNGAVNQFKGIVGRAYSVPARYGQQPNANLILNLKTYGTHRTPVYTGDNAVNSGSMNYIQTAYIERCGLVDPLGSIASGNYFGIDYVDPLNTSRNGIGYSAVEGFWGMGKILRSTGQPAAYGSFRSYNQESAATRKTLFVDSVLDSNLLHYEEIYDKTGASSVPLRWYSDKGYVPPVIFNNGSRTFSFVHGSFTATLLSTATSILTGTGYYCRKGNEISLRVAFTIPAATLTSINGYIRISGLPYAISNIGYAHGAVRWPALVSGTRLNPQVDSGTIKLFVDSAENEAVGASVINTAYGSSSILVVNLTYRTDDI